MKKLHLRRHGKKDGPNDTIGPQGLEQTRREGVEAVRNGNSYQRLFYGPLVRTAQTALAFLEAFMRPPITMPVVQGLGDDALFKEIVNDTFKRAIAAGQTNLAATLMAHPSERCTIWQMHAGAAVEQMFDALGEGEMGLGFFHSPTIEMAASSFGFVVTDLKLAELEGLEFTQDANGVVRVTTVIRVTQEAAS